MQFKPTPRIGGRILTIMKMITLHLSGMQEEGLCDGEETQEGLNYCSALEFIVQCMYI